MPMAPASYSPQDGSYPMGALLLVQMSGAPGAGKSTVAHAIGRRTGAVVLDHDVTKSALLEAGLAWIIHEGRDTSREPSGMV